MFATILDIITKVIYYLTIKVRIASNSLTYIDFNQIEETEGEKLLSIYNPAD